MSRALLCAAVAAGLLACGGTSGDYRVELDVGNDIRALGSDDLDVSEPAADRLAALGPAAVPALVRALAREPAAVRAGVVDLLGRIDDAAARAALAGVAARDADVAVRGAAITALAAAPGSDESRSVVEAALDDPAPDVRRAAAGACAALCGSPAALERLATLAIEDQPLPNGIAARAAVIQILAGDDPARAEHVRAAIRAHAAPALQASDGGTALRAALLASDVGDTGGRDVLERAVRSDGAPPLLRLQATYVLGLVGDEETVAALAALDGQPGFGEYGYDALRRLAGRNVDGAQAALDRWRGSRPPGELPPPPGAR